MNNEYMYFIINPCSVPKAEPHCKPCFERNCNYVLQAGEPSFYKLVAYVFVRPGSLSVEGQEPAVVYVIMQNN